MAANAILALRKITIMTKSEERMKEGKGREKGEVRSGKENMNRKTNRKKAYIFNHAVCSIDPLRIIIRLQQNTLTK